jgi:hypothetical protein
VWFWSPAESPLLEGKGPPLSQEEESVNRLAHVTVSWWKLMEAEVLFCPADKQAIQQNKI